MSSQRLQEDNQWTLGQLLSDIILGAAPLSVLNAWKGMFSSILDAELIMFRFPRERCTGENVRQVKVGIFQYPPEYTRSDTEMQNLIQ